MLKHCSGSTADVSRRSLRHSSLTLDTDTSLVSSLQGGQVYRQPGGCSLRGHGCQLYRQSACSVSLHALSTADTSSDTSSEAADLADQSLSPARGGGEATCIRVYAACLRPHLAYKTIVVTAATTSRQVISSLLARFRMRHRDHKLYQLTMEVTVNSALQTITLEDSSRPAELLLCNPWQGAKFILRAQAGGRVRVYDDQIRAESVYKSIIISRETTVADTLQLLAGCYGTKQLLDRPDRLSLYEADPSTGRERLLEAGECPLQLSEDWDKGTEAARRFVLRFRPPDQGPPPPSPPPAAVARLPGLADTDQDGFIIVKRSSFLRQSVRKKNFLRSMICLSGGLKTVDINIDTNSLGDTEDTETESETSDLAASELGEARSDEDMEEDSLAHSEAVILESFFT